MHLEVRQWQVTSGARGDLCTSLRCTPWGTVSNARHDWNKSGNSNTSSHVHAYMMRRLPAIWLVALQLVINCTFVVNEFRMSSWHGPGSYLYQMLWTLIPIARKLICFNCDHGHAAMVRRLVASRFGKLWERYNFDRGQIGCAWYWKSFFVLLVSVRNLRICEAYGKCCGWHCFSSIQRLLRLRQYCYHFFGPISLPLLNMIRETAMWPWEPFRIDRVFSYDGFHRCFTLLPQLDSAEHLHVWPHLAEAMLVVEDILAVLDNPAFMFWRYIGCSGYNASYAGQGWSLSKVEAALVFHWKPRLLRPWSLCRVEAALVFNWKPMLLRLFKDCNPGQPIINCKQKQRMLVAQPWDSTGFVRVSVAVSTWWGVVSHVEGIMAEHGSSCLCLPAGIFKKTWCSLHTSKMYTVRNCVQRTPWLKQIWRILPLCDDRWQRHVWARLDMFVHVCLDLNCCQGEPLTWVGMLISFTWLCQVWYLTWCQEEPLTWVGMLVSFTWLCQVWYLTWCQGEQLTWVGMLISFTWLCQV